MTEMLWKVASEERLRDHVREQDARFQIAMRAELELLAAERGLTVALPTPAQNQLPATPPKAREARPRDVLNIKLPSPVDVPLTDMQRIIVETCEKHGFTRAELFSARRNRMLVAARHEAMYRMSKETPMSLPAIGRRLGGRDHTTVLHGIRKYAAKLAKECQS